MEKKVGEKMEYSIQEVCKRLSLTVHTVRYYCDKGLVPNIRRDKNGNRLFDEQAVNWLQAAVFLRCSGLSVAEVRHYFTLCRQGSATVPERYQILSELQQKTEQEEKTSMSVLTAFPRRFCIIRTSWRVGARMIAIR